ncbi:MAG: PQQ-binding-like beta-propeller repeat protein [bacterium]
MLSLLFGAGPLFSAPTDMGVTYVKTLGQSGSAGLPLKGTGLRQVAVDAEGNLYFAVVNGWPALALVKITADGKVAWENEFGAGARTIPVTLADNQLYACRINANEFNLSRLDTTSGKIDPAWGVTWTEAKPDAKLMRKIESASALVAAGPYLFIADTAGNEIRRLDRATAVEKPFAARLMVVDPISLAVARNGNLLVLTAESVLELDPDGKPVHVPLIEGLNASQTIQVDPRSGNIYIAQGGGPGGMVNQILQYDAAGKPTGVALGRGGEFNGKWAPDVFAFSSGYADFTLDAQGGLWVNNGLGQLVHFAATGQAFKNDRVLLSLEASAIAVDNQLNVYLGLVQGGVKLSWDNQVLWTSGVRPSGDGQRYPSCPVNGWPVYLGYAGAKAPVFYATHNGIAYALAPDTGELVGKAGGPGQTGGLPRLTSAGDTLYMGFGAKDNWAVTQGTHETLADWKNWKPFMTPPPELKATLLGVSPDKTRVYFYDGKEALCLDTAGKVLWRQPSPAFSYVQPVAFLGDRVIFLPGLGGKLVARDARTGAELAVIGGQAADGRPAINGFAGLAAASRDGKDYLFVAGNWQIQVFEITATGGAK